MQNWEKVIVDIAKEMSEIANMLLDMYESANDVWVWALDALPDNLRHKAPKPYGYAPNKFALPREK